MNYHKNRNVFFKLLTNVGAIVFLLSNTALANQGSSKEKDPHRMTIAGMYILLGEIESVGDTNYQAIEIYEDENCTKPHRSLGPVSEYASGDPLWGYPGEIKNSTKNVIENLLENETVAKCVELKNGKSIRYRTSPSEMFEKNGGLNRLRFENQNDTRTKPPTTESVSNQKIKRSVSSVPKNEK